MKIGHEFVQMCITFNPKILGITWFWFWYNAFEGIKLIAPRIPKLSIIPPQSVGKLTRLSRDSLGSKLFRASLSKKLEKEKKRSHPLARQARPERNRLSVCRLPKLTLIGAFHSRMY